MRPLSIAGIARLGLVQAALGSLVVLATSSMNRVMVIEIGLPAIIPGALVAFHYAIQVLRPAMGHASDRGGRRTPFIFGGMAALALGVLGAAASIGVMQTDRASGIALSIASYAMIGAGVGAAGTSVLVLLAARVAAERRALAATIVWMMMIFGIAVTAGVSGKFLDPFSPARLLSVAAVASFIALVLTAAGALGIEGSARAAVAMPHGSFRAAAGSVWAEPRAKNFTIFVFLSMLAYSAQELILEPFAASVFAMTPGQTASLSGLQHGGVFLGMLGAAIVGSVAKQAMRGPLVLAGCAASAAASLFLAGAAGIEPFPLRGALLALGVANGVFAVSAIGAMIGLSREGAAGHEGTRMGLFGAAQAVAFAAGGIVGPLGSDVFRHALGSNAAAYGGVFAVQAALFSLAAIQASRVFPVTARYRAAFVRSAA